MSTENGSSPAAKKAKKNKSVCIIGGGNAAHVLSALLPYKGYETFMYCPYKDEAERIQAGMKENPDQTMQANFASHNTPSGLVTGAPSIVSKHPQDVIPDADVIVMPLPSFTYPSTLEQIKPYVREGQILMVTPGQGGFDWYAKQILGDELFRKVTFCGLMPMPFNCRIAEYGKRVEVQEFKKKYSIGVSPVAKLDECLKMVEELFGSVKPCGASGSFLECTMYPINAIIHPARLYTLLGDYKPDDKSTFLKENPLFYEDMTTEATDMMDAVNQEVIKVGDTLSKHDGLSVSVPHIFDWLAVYVYDEPKASNLQKFFSTSEAYKGFRCPVVLKDKDDPSSGFVPDFTNRYFTEDINLGLVGYKGLADIAGVETPIINKIISWAQHFMGKEFLVDGRLAGKDLNNTNAPQRFGIASMEDLKKLYPAPATDSSVA